MDGKEHQQVLCAAAVLACVFSGSLRIILEARKFRARTGMLPAGEARRLKRNLILSFAGALLISTVAVFL